MKPALKTTGKSIQQATSKKKQVSGAYNLIKGTKTALSPFCDLYEACKRDTNQIWHAKIINNEILHQYGLGDCLQFNVEVLKNCKKLQYVVYVEQIFQIGKNTFIIQQKYDKNLVQRVNQFYPMHSSEIEGILEQVISGVLEIYKQKYATRNLRPQHIVCVDDVWKIQSFVLNSQLYGVQSQYCWSQKFSSPEDKNKQQQLQQRKIDQQLIWNIGILGLYMILGPNYQYQKIVKDTSIPWNKVKQNASQCLYKFLVKALKVDFKDRMKLSQLFQDQLFKNLKQSATLPFMSYSKFYGSQSDRQKKQTTQLNLSQIDQKKIILLKNDIQRFVYFGQVQKYVQQLPYKNTFDSSLIRYLCYKIQYENLYKLRNQIEIWKRTSPNLKKYAPLKQIEEDLNMYINNAKQKKLSYSKSVRGNQYIKSEIPTIKGSLSSQIIDDKIPYSQIVALFNKISGSIYSLLSKQCQNKTNQNKQRTLCYYSLGAYLIHFYDTEKFVETKNYQKNGILNLIKLLKQAPINFLIKLTQNLIKLHFAISNQV